MSPNEPQPTINSPETLSSPKSVAIITMSTRTPRVGPQVAALVKSIIESNPEASSNITIHPIDLATFNLPVFNEPVIPAMVPAQASFTHQHSKDWSAAVAAHDAYVLVIPEYNDGMAGGTKNAIDYLKNEWDGKPAMVVSYGIQGGKLASEQAHGSIQRQGVKTTVTRPNLVFFGSAGPELYSAMLQGELGEQTRKQWTEEESVNILKGFGELRALLFEPIPVLEEKKA
ncbi:flavo protein-like protein [Coniochaeta sp. 2T2.1]|nr:flavo protein-like protein [Coniochaeta sp. 2T2.1]